MTAIGRVTHLTVRNSTLANLQTNLQKMSELQAQASSGKKINRASDDPSGASDILQLRGEQRMLDQYERNASDGGSWLNTIDTALQTAVKDVTAARTLVVRGGDGALGDASRVALAEELDGLRADLLRQANTTYLGRSVFAGTTSAPAFTGDGEFRGVPGGTVTRTVADGATVRVDSTGSAVFGDGEDSVFALLDSISATLRAGGDPTDQLEALDKHFNAMLTEASSVGARANQIETAQTRLTDQKLTTTTRLSQIEDIDLAQIILDLQTQEVAYKGALGAAAKVLQPTLLDYLR